MSLKRILNITHATTPALVTASYNATTTQPYGAPRSSLIHIQAIRGGGAAMTAVKFKIQGARDPASPVWVDLMGVRLGDSTATVQAEHTLAVSAGTTAEDAIGTENTRDWPVIRIVAKAVTADAVSGDSAGAWVGV